MHKKAISFFNFIFFTFFVYIDNGVLILIKAALFLHIRYQSKGLSYINNTIRIKPVFSSKKKMIKDLTAGCHFLHEL